MGLGAWAALLLCALQVLALPGAATAQGSISANHSVPLQNSSVTTTEPVIEHVVSNHTGELNSTSKPSTTSVSSNVTVTVSSSVTMKPATIAKMSTPRGSPNVTSTALKSTPKAASVLPNTMQTSTSAMTTAHNTLLTSSAITATIHSKESKGPKFDAGSFVGGIVLTLGALSIFYIGCRVYYSRRGIRYRSIDEHDAII
ncbi:porimin [Nannospalax galili]|uniref:porimin n=1 Tax=Nannospalax galili TaxID=1026970 RepID=UPI0004ED1733|nr:porimin [Nannospalax galili]